MRHTINISLMCCVVLNCFIAGCGKKKGEAAKPMVVVGEDTLTAAEIVPIFHDSTSTEKVVRQCALQVSLAKKAAPVKDAAAFTKSVDEITQQLTLRSDRKWNEKQTATLIGAARALRVKLDEAENASDVSKYVDSLFAGISLVGGIRDSSLLLSSAMNLDTQLDGTPMSKRMALTALLGRTFDLPPEVADIVADYASESADGRDTVAVANIVKGLVRDRSKQDDMAKAKMHALARKKADNSALALRYRTRASILDSIEKHLPYLKALYKKKLKIHTDMAGKVMVSFRVDANGKVMIARITRSDIAEADFIDPLREYVKTIRFQPIPKKIGPMTFEFPFEFQSEG